MKAKIFTLLFCLVAGVSSSVYGQLNLGSGVTWGELAFSEQLVLSEDFTGFDFFHSDSTPDMGNSNNMYDPLDASNIIYGYMNDTVEVSVIGSGWPKIKYYFHQCAFAPEWQSAYAYANATSNTANVSDGFVEISRDYGETGGYAPTVRGHFYVDLRDLEFVEGIQWTHSSTGGNKRGVQCEYSFDGGDTWDTLRYQPGVDYSFSFTRDPGSGTTTMNGYRCDPSAYGMTWEDGIYSSGIMLRFLECGGQTARIHDLKVYGTYITSTEENFQANELKVYTANRMIKISEPSEVKVYSITGTVVKYSASAEIISMNDMPRGIYLVNAKSGSKTKTAKVFIR